MAEDLNRKFAARLENIEQRLQRQERSNQLEAASVTSGRVRFIGGLLRVDSGGRVEIVGTLAIDGTTTVTGSFTVSGPWSLTGNGTITGNVTISGNVTSTGTLTQNGPWNLNGAGNIAGNVTQTGNTTQQGNVTLTGGGKITVAGSDPIVITQEGGQAKIKVGTTGEIAGSDAGIQMMVAGDPNRRVLVTPDAIRLIGVTNAASDAVPDFWLGIQLDGTLRRYSPGSGGPMGGDFDWPFSLSLVTSEYGMRIHPITGIETMHNGIDFGAPNGANIPAASGGTVLTVGSDSGRGNYVVLSHAGGVETHYFHMLSTPSVSEGQVVSKGTTLGQVGSTGASTAPHLHFEVHVGGSPINPRDFAGLD